ncbi:large ribosomal subunit protein mL64 [Calonectris borealis]|uniref:large ribosomal subunit protein mL64 n=1 Tax=Calonectris borealis TaxID=1323832 RepID=UPI003F4B17FA
MAAPLRRALAAALGRARVSLAIAAPARRYRAAPLRRRSGPAPADPADLRAAARRFGRLGEAAAVPVWRLWPDPERLRAAEAEEREWDPPLREVEAALDRREREEARRREERQRLVAGSLAAMPARVSAWRQERAQARERARQDAARRQRLLAEAGLGGGLSRPGTPPRGSPQAQALLQDLERRQRREEKRRRRQEREEVARSAMAAAEAAAASRPPPGVPPESAGAVSS